MTDTIAEIRARHKEVTVNWMHGYTDRDGVHAHADRAALLARVAELEAKEAKDFEALDEIADVLCKHLGPQVLHQDIADVDDAVIAEHDAFRDEMLPIAAIIAALPTLRAALTQPAAVEDGELRRLMAEATPGPWTEQDGIIGTFIEGRYEWSLVANVAIAPDQDATEREGQANAALIVAAVNALPGLMAERDRMKEALEELRDGDFNSRGVQMIVRAALGEQPNAAIDIMVAASPHALEGEQP